jgi:hypothetical protein
MKHSRLITLLLALAMTALIAPGCSKKQKKKDPKPGLHERDKAAGEELDKHAPPKAAEAGPSDMTTGNAPVYPQCAANSDCASHGEICVMGTCKQCAADADCQASLGSCGRCENNTCVKAEGCCSRDSDCASGRRCRGGSCR